MLDAKSLAVLQSLKSDIQANKEVFTGNIKGTGKSFGFVVADDGDEHFLPPDQMSKVFPGDRVTFTVTEQQDGKTRAELESLESSDLEEFTGVYVVRGKAQGVEPFNDKFSGWLFVPPKQTADAASNSLVVARVTRHPWKTGKAQAEVKSILGSIDNNRSWYSVSLREYGLQESFTDPEKAEATQLVENNPHDYSEYKDLTALPFVTIDAETTRDMDDALYAEKTDSGWKLWVAIADASSFIKPGSKLDKAARSRLTTTYLPGLTLPMVPSELSDNAMSLVEGDIRPALVTQLSIDTEGHVTDIEICEAQIRNHAKLSYTEASEWLDSEQYPDRAHTLPTVHQACLALASWRKKRSNPTQDRADYRIRVDEEFNVTHVDKELRNSARDLVEEAMIATNHQISEWLSDTPSLFLTHSGFKADRETELKGLLREFAPTVSELDGHNFEQFIRIVHQAAKQKDFPLSQVLQKRFDRSQWSVTAAPHFALGLSSYTNATSPIRKYTDLIIHRLIKAKLNGQAVEAENELIAELNERGNLSRQVSQAIENRLRLQWLSADKEAQWQGTIVHLNANGLIVELNDNGARGFVDLRKQKDQFSYDPLRMMLKFEDSQFQLGQPLTVKATQISNDNLTLAIVD